MLPPKATRTILAFALSAFGDFHAAEGQEAPAAAGTFTVESVTTLEVGPAAVSSPKWSPDGQWIAFSLPKGEGIGLVRPDGSGLRKLSGEAGSGYRFAWSPDSSRIAYRAARREKGARQYAFRVVEVASGEIESTSEVVKDAQPPVWQRGPEGMRWASRGPTGELAGNWRAARGLPHADKVTPPVLVQRDRGLWLQTAKGTAQRKVSGNIGLNPAWSRDGKHVLFDALDTIAISTPEELAAPARTLCAGQHPAWSPDGKWIVYQITRDHSHAPDDARQHTPDTMPHRHDDKTNHQIVDSDLWIIEPDGKNRHQLTNTPDILEVDPDWSPDGNFIVCRIEGVGRLIILKLGRR